MIFAKHPEVYGHICKYALTRIVKDLVSANLSITMPVTLAETASAQNRIKSGCFGAFVAEMKKSTGSFRWLVGACYPLRLGG